MQPGCVRNVGDQGEMLDLFGQKTRENTYFGGFKRVFMYLWETQFRLATRSLCSMDVVIRSLVRSMMCVWFHALSSNKFDFTLKTETLVHRPTRNIVISVHE